MLVLLLRVNNTCIQCQMSRWNLSSTCQNAINERGSHLIKRGPKRPLRNETHKASVTNLASTQCKENVSKGCLVFCPQVLFQSLPVTELLFGNYLKAIYFSCSVWLQKYLPLNCRKTAIGEQKSRKLFKFFATYYNFPCRLHFFRKNNAVFLQVGDIFSAIEICNCKWSFIVMQLDYVM